MKSLKGTTLFITGGSRGIGLAIALRAASDAANVVIAAKTVAEHPKLPGTIYSAAEAIERAGGKALPIALDIRDELAVGEAVKKAAEKFGGIDILVNNASAISMTGTLETPMKRFDLMFDVDVRGTFACSQACLPYLIDSARKGRAAHILTLSPPLNLNPRWFKDHVAYTIAKYGMSMCVLGMAAEFRDRGVAVNALWPRTIIATAAVTLLPGMEGQLDHTRKPEIVADAAHSILTREVGSEADLPTGNFYIDEDVLASAGISDLSRYAVKVGVPLTQDIFLD